MLARRLIAGANNGSFHPSDLFANGEEGGSWIPAETSTLWQDTAATTAVSADGDPVQRIDDISGNGNHLTNASTPPTYKTASSLHWLLFDGVDDYLVSGTLGSNVMTGSGFMCVAVSNDNANEVGIALLEEGVSNSQKRVYVASDTRTSKRFYYYGPDTTNRYLDRDSELDTDVHVLSAENDADAHSAYTDSGAESGSISSSATFGESTRISMGRQTYSGGSLYLDGNMYGALIIDRALTSAEQTNLENYFAALAGL
ncbi:hypothetical protein ACFVYJ_01595 [Pontibacter sp. JAM-7]|uniref:hypothetical protein n=1 Tax=Pontibacter sp. JAM-7 TaxID=3366581 RepID=UPI003AF56C71